MEARMNDDKVVLLMSLIDSFACNQTNGILSHLFDLKDFSPRSICLPDRSRIQAVKKDYATKMEIGYGDLRNGVYVFASPPASALVANIDPFVLHQQRQQQQRPFSTSHFSATHYPVVASS
ncbi:unnamed protein product [Cuscuta campestris]|uniref:Uncharacterized protein n=1 Tax=Cuscuta campestris TaxID=132261 RepID=A0A484MM60_9ASTE|nr:unnamed protein product [Cuscuta campestris]